MNTKTAERLIETLEGFAKTHPFLLKADGFTVAEIAQTLKASAEVPEEIRDFFAQSPKVAGKRLGIAGRLSAPARVAAGRPIFQKLGLDRLSGGRWGFRAFFGELPSLPRPVASQLAKAIDDGAIRRLEKVALALSRPGLPIDVCAALRMAVAEGLQVLERSLPATKTEETR